MSYSTARALLLLLFKSHKNVKTVIPSVFSLLGNISSYTSIISNNDQGWTNAFIYEVDDDQKLKTLDTTVVMDAIKAQCDAENILLAAMVYSIECVKDTSSDPENDIFFAVAFALSKDKIDQFPQDWYKATPYMSSCPGYKRATVFKVLGEDPQYPYINIAVWSSLDSWRKAIATEESKEAHAHQDYVQRTPFIGKQIQSSSV